MGAEKLYSIQQSPQQGWSVYLQTSVSPFVKEVGSWSSASFCPSLEAPKRLQLRLHMGGRGKRSVPPQES